MIKRIALMFFVLMGVAVFTSDVQGAVVFSEDWNGYLVDTSVDPLVWSENLTGGSAPDTFRILDPGDGNLALATNQGFGSSAISSVTTVETFARAAGLRVSWILWQDNATNLASDPNNGARGMGNNTGLFHQTITNHGQYDLIHGMWEYLNWTDSAAASAHATSRFFFTEGRRHWTHQLDTTVAPAPNNPQSGLYLAGQDVPLPGGQSRGLFDALFAATTRATAVHFRVYGGAINGGALEYSPDQGGTWIVPKINYLNQDANTADPVGSNPFGGNMYGGAGTFPAPNSLVTLRGGIGASLEPATWIDDFQIEDGISVVPVEVSGFMLD